MAEKRDQFKARLEKVGLWTQFVSIRENLKAEGMTAADAKAEALRRLGLDGSRPVVSVEEVPPSMSGAPIASTGDALPEPILDYTTPADDGAPQQLQDMRHVYLNHPIHDKTQAHKQIRTLLTARPSEFFSQLSRLEKDHRDYLVQSNPRPQADAIDLGTERAISLCEDLILSIAANAEREADEMRPDYQCPNCGHLGVLPITD